MTNMLVHVFAWYSIIWSLTLAQGNPVNTQELSGNGTNVTGVVLTGEPINRCNARCSTKVRFCIKWYLCFLFESGLIEPRYEKPAFCICENKDADQLRGNREADQRLCFRYSDGMIPLLSKSKISRL